MRWSVIMADHMYVCVLSPLATGHIARRDKNDIEDALAETRDGRRRHRLLIHRLRLELIQTARHTQHTQHKDKAKRYSPQGMLACFDATPIKVLGLLLKRALTVTSSAPSILIFPSCSTLLCSALLPSSTPSSLIPRLRGTLPFLCPAFPSSTPPSHSYHIKYRLAMNVNKKFDRFKQWGRERMGSEVKTDNSDDFKMLEVEMALRQEGKPSSILTSTCHETSC